MRSVNFCHRSEAEPLRILTGDENARQVSRPSLQSANPVAKCMRKRDSTAKPDGIRMKLMLAGIHLPISWVIYTCSMASQNMARNRLRHCTVPASHRTPSHRSAQAPCLERLPRKAADSSAVSTGCGAGCWSRPHGLGNRNPGPVVVPTGFVATVASLPGHGAAFLDRVAIGEAACTGRARPPETRANLILHPGASIYTRLPEDP